MKFRFYRSPRSRIQFVLMGMTFFSVQTKALGLERTTSAASSDEFTTRQVKWVNPFAFRKLKDTLPVAKDTVRQASLTKIVISVPEKKDTVDLRELQKSPYVSLQQYLKGNIAGLYVQENSGEPGTIQNMILRGISTPIFSNKDIAAVQPTVYINGLPLIQNHPFMYDIKMYDINPNGSASNLYAGIDLSNISSIEAIKDPVRLAQLGPLASNGVIWITTNDATKLHHEKVSLDFGYGIVAPPKSVSPINGKYALNFRKQFYEAYNLPFNTQQLPTYLQDQEDINYFGNADWAESYYKLGQQYKINAGIEGGGEIANFLFNIGSVRNSGISDNTSYAKNNISFFMNMKPTKELTVKAMLNGTMADRKRNKNLRDRYAEVEYLPDLSFPMAPNGAAYGSFRELDKETLDQNKNNFINGYLKADYTKRGLNIGAEFLLDYNADTRHVFWPSTLMESVSFISDYSGFNRRIVVNGYGSYNFSLNQDNRIIFKLTTGYNGDLHDYNYSRAFDGSSDKYKTTGSGSYKIHNYLDKENGRLVTNSFNVDYSYKEILNLSALLRYDGYSKMQADNRWLFNPAFALKWNAKEHLLKDNSVLSKLLVSASLARIGKLIGYDRFSVGPYYNSNNLNWIGQSVIPSYVNFASVTRPYKEGWSDYNISWPYSEKLNVDLDGSLANGRLDLGLSLYSNTDKNMIVPISVPVENGFSFRYLSGMNVQNRGVDLRIASQIFNNPNGVSWRMEGNLNYNQNKLLTLPLGMSELQIGERKLEVGKAIDAFWVYENKGVYANSTQIPVQNGTSLTYSRIPFQTGDAIWTDRNNDNIINSDDKVVKGHSLPQVTGGFNSRIAYRNWDLSFNFFFALGHNTLNERDAQRYDFSRLDAENSLRTIQEVFFWQEKSKNYTYPLYNPNSEIDSYRGDQDLFLQDLSYLKLRSLSLGYAFDVGKTAQKTINKSGKNTYVYFTANNLWTWTKFESGDPELIEFNGYFTGYGQNIPFTASLGVHYKF
jgi:TonB-linked SusC/RagA family outer membrane protein